VWKASRYHGEMRGPQQLACRAGGGGLARPLGFRIHCHCLGCRNFLRTGTAPRADEFWGTRLPAAEFSATAPPLPNSLPLPPGCPISWRCLRCRILRQLRALKMVMENYFPGNFARLAFMCVGWFRKNPRVEEVPGTLPRLPQPCERLLAGWRGARPAADSDTRGKGLPKFTRTGTPAKFTAAASRAAAFSWNCLRSRTLLRTGHAYRSATTHHVLDAALHVSTDMDMACSTLLQQASLVPPSRVKFIGQRVQLCARGLDGRAPRRATPAGHPEQRGTLSPMNLVPWEAVPALPPAKPCS